MHHRIAAVVPRNGWLLLAGLVVSAVMAPTLLYPFGRDQAVFAYVGRTIAEGGMPYRDAWDLKPPAIYLIYAGLTRMAPSAEGTMLLVRLADILLAGITGVLLAALGRRYGQPLAGLSAAAWYAALYLQGGYWGLAQTEAWANPCLMGIALLCQTSGKAAQRSAFGAAGVLTACAALLKFTAILPILPLLLIGLWHHRSNSRATVLCFGVGMLAPLVAAIAWLAAGDALTAYLDIQQGFVATYTRLTRSGSLEHLARIGLFTFPWILSGWLPASLAGVALVNSGVRRENPSRLGALMLVGGLCAVWLQDKYFGYHWITVLPGLTLLAGMGSVCLLRSWGLSPRKTAATVLCLPVAWALIANWSYYRDAGQLVVGRCSQDRWLERFGRPGHGDHSFLADLWVARLISATTTPKDTIVVWGFEPSIYLLSNRRSPTRFFFNVPVVSHFTPKNWRTEYLKDLREHPPRLFIVARHDAIPWASGTKDDSRAQLHQWPELNTWLLGDYDYEQEVEDFTIYRRKPIRVR